MELKNLKINEVEKRSLEKDELAQKIQMKLQISEDELNRYYQSDYVGNLADFKESFVSMDEAPNHEDAMLSSTQS